MSDKKENEEKKTPNPTVEQIPQPTYQEIQEMLYKDLKQEHPAWTEEQIWEEVDNIF